MTGQYARRRRKTRQWLETGGADAMLVTSAPNVYYLTGFRGEGMVLVGDECVISTDRRYEVEAGQVSGKLTTVFDPDGHLAGILAALRQAKVKRLVFEAETTTYAAYETLSARMEGIELVPSRKVIEEQRVVKDKDEIAVIQRACDLISRVLESFAEGLQPGVTERKAALELDRLTMLAGSEKMAFDTIMAFGPSAAKPHAVPSDRELEPGMMVKIDCGARVDGYCSDITRTYLIGEPDRQLREIYTAVYEAQAAAVAACRPGMKGSQLDAVAREMLCERGYGEQFAHSLGHGVGLEVHELPRVSQRSEDELKSGMVITIEPGLYLEGWGGVRIEDTVLLTNNGHQVMTSAPKQVIGAP